jgi:alpha-mannosidase
MYRMLAVMAHHVSNPTRRVFLGVSAAALGSLPAHSADSGPLYLLTYDHGGLILWGIDHLAARLRDALAWLDRYPGFKIGLENEAYTYDSLAEHDPKLLAEIRAALQRYAGRFGIGTCTYGQPLSTFINEESNIRQIAYALEADRRHFGCSPETYLMSEHAMHSQLPQILVGFGFRSAIMRSHFMMYGYNPTFDAAVGWWTGPDGSRIPAVPTYKGEGAEFGRTTTDNWILTRCPGPDCKGSLEEFRAQYAHLAPAIATRADDSDLRREDLVRQTEGRPDYRWILLEDLRRVLPQPTTEFKTGPNDFTVRMPWGYCGNEIWNQNRRAEAAVLTAERLATLELLAGGANREAELDKAWKKLLVGQHHDVQICGLLPEARRFLTTSIDTSESVSAASLQYFATRMEGGPAAQVTVFNPHSWPRAEWVEATFTLPRRFAKTIEIRHGDRVVPSVLLSALRASDDSLQEARLALLAEAPPLGFASYTVASASIPKSDLAAVTPYWDIRSNADGGIAAVADRVTGQMLLRDARFAAVIEGKPCVAKGKWRVRPALPGAPWTTAIEEGVIGGIPYRLEMTSWAASPRLDFRVVFEFDGQRIGALSDNKRDARSPFIHEDKLRFKFYPAAREGSVGIRDLPFVIAETPDAYIQGNYWTAIADGRTGLAVFNRGAMCCVREADGGVSIPLAYSMYYIWGTRMLSGKYSYAFALYPFAGPWTAAGLHRAALEYNFPCRVHAGQPGNGRMGNHVTLLEADGEGVIASALYSKDGTARLRLYENQGHAAQARLHYSAGPAKFVETDLAGNAGQVVDSLVPFRPWQIRTFRLQI